MGEVRDRGVLATELGLAVLNDALARTESDLSNKCWNQTELAGKAKVSDRTVRRFFKREAAIGEVNARSICLVLGVCFEDVVEIVDGVVVEPDKTGQLGPNPFEYGSPVIGDRFFGRDRELAFIRDRLLRGTSVSLVGLRRIGKTSLLKQVIERRVELLGESQTWVLVYLDLATGVGQGPETVIEGLRRGIEKQIGRTPWPREDNLDPWVFQEGLEDVRSRGFRVVVMLDEFEAIGRRLDAFDDWGNDWRSKASVGELFTLMTASQRSLSEFYEEHRKTSPFDNIFNPLDVGPLDEKGYDQLVGAQLMGRLGEGKEGWLDAVADRWPYYVQAAASALWDCGLDEVAAERLFLGQVEGRFAMLWRDLTEGERSALFFLLEGTGTAPKNGLRDRLVRYGVVRSDGRLFSEAFGYWIRENGGGV
jgi:hypothetical protein